MIWGEFVVSDDSHFMKEGFNLLYEGSEKMFMTSGQFNSYMDGLSRQVH